MKIIELIIFRGISNIIAIATDNEPLMISVCKILTNKFPIIIHVPCAAHIIQLCLKKIFEIDKIKNLGKNINDIIYLINNNKMNKVKLNDLQLADNIKNPLSLLFYTSIRWSSIIIAIKRILDLEKYIKIIMINEKNEQFWSDLKLLYIFLKPIEEYTNIIQKDNASLYSVWTVFDKLLTFYNSKEIPDIFINEAKIVIDIINSYWKKYIDEDLINIVKLFCFDKNIKITKKQTNFIIDWGSLYLKKYILCEETNINKMKKIISVQIGKFLSKQHNFSDIDTIISNVKESDNNNDNIVYISKIVWGTLMVDNYELSKIAISLLSIYPTESCVERSFSALSDIHSLERNRLNNDIIDAEMIIKFNI